MQATRFRDRGKKHPRAFGCFTVEEAKVNKNTKGKELVIPAAFATVFTIPARSGKAHEPARRLASGLTGKLF
jgi:hypothetical protein